MRCACLVLAMLLTGGGSAAQAETPQSDARPKIVWTPDMTEEGGYFETRERFGNYVKRAQVVAIGSLLRWDGKEGTLRVDKVLRGRAAKELPLVSAGGFVRPKPGTKVVAMLSPRDGKLVLHAFCPAGGVYTHSEPLEAYLVHALAEADGK